MSVAVNCVGRHFCWRMDSSMVLSKVKIASREVVPPPVRLTCNSISQVVEQLSRGYRGTSSL